MKAVTVVFNVSIEEEILAALQKAGVTDFTQWPRIVGRGTGTGPRMDSHVWPGANSGILAVVAADAASKLMEELQTVHDSPAGRQAGVFAYLTSVEQTLRARPEP